MAKLEFTSCTPSGNGTSSRRATIGVTSAPGRSRARELAQRFRLGIDGDDTPAASQNFDDVAAVTAAEIDRQRIGGCSPNASSAATSVRRGGRSRSFS